MKFISLLRGINVNAQKKIKMTDLKALYGELGFQDVVTYIQSGNVIFGSESKNKTDLNKRIESAIEEKCTYYVPVVLRTNSEISGLNA